MFFLGGMFEFYFVLSYVVMFSGTPKNDCSSFCEVSHFSHWSHLYKNKPFLQGLLVADGAVERGQTLLDPLQPGPGGLQRLLEGLLLLQSQLAASQPLAPASQQGLMLRLQLSRHARLAAVASPAFVQGLRLLTQALKGISEWRKKNKKQVQG